MKVINKDYMPFKAESIAVYKDSISSEYVLVAYIGDTVMERIKITETKILIVD